MAGSVLFYVQHLLGIGHLQRARRIANALAARDIKVTLVAGGMPVAELAAGRTVRVVQLPPIRARDASFTLLDEAGRPVDARLWQARREALLAAYAAARPDVVVIEGFPFARRAFRGELDPLIATARGAARLVSSIRDILVRRDDPARHRAIAERVRADFDLVLVHGDPAFIPLEASFPAAAEIADRLRYTGYVAAPKAETADAEESGDERTGVIVSAGGGAAGRALLQTALLVRRAGVLAAAPWRLLAGPNLPEPEFRALGSGLPPNVIVERFRPDLPRLLRRARVSVSQAGYNTVLDVLAARAPAVFVPFAEGRESEQSARAEQLAARGVAEVVSAAALSPEHLAAAMQGALARGPGALALDTNGARRSADLIAGLIGAPDRPAGPPA